MPLSILSLYFSWKSSWFSSICHRGCHTPQYILSVYPRAYRTIRCSWSGLRHYHIIADYKIQRPERSCFFLNYVMDVCHSCRISALTGFSLSEKHNSMESGYTHYTEFPLCTAGKRIVWSNILAHQYRYDLYTVLCRCLSFQPRRKNFYGYYLMKNAPVIKICHLKKQYRLGTISSDLQSRWTRFRGKEDPTILRYILYSVSAVSGNDERRYRYHTQPRLRTVPGKK